MSDGAGFQVFVGSLPADISEEELKYVFQSYGDVKNIRILRAEDRKGKGADLSELSGSWHRRLNRLGAARQSADAALRGFAEQDAAWAVSRELLSDADPNVQFFGAQTLCRRVQRAAQGYPEPAAGDLKDWVPVLLKHLETDATKPSKQQLVVALAAVVVALCSTTWKTGVADLLALAERQPKIAWGTLVIIPEQLSEVVHKYLKADARTLALLHHAQGMLDMAVRYQPTSDEAPTGTLGDPDFSLALQTLTQWSKVMGLQLLEHEGFAQYLIGLLSGPAGNFEVVMDAVVEVLRRTPGAFIIYEPVQTPVPALEGLLGAVSRAMKALLPTLQSAAQQQVSLDMAEGRLLQRWAELAGTLVEAYTQLLWLDAESSEVLLAFIGACFVVHPQVAQAVAELWAILKDAQRDSKLPEGVMPKILHRLVEPSILSFVRFGRFDSPHTEDRSDLVQLRSSQQDILVDMYCIAAGTAEAQLVLNGLFSSLEKSESATDLLGMEVVWYAFQGISEVLADEPAIPDVYNKVLPTVFRVSSAPAEVLSTGAALLRGCGPHFEERLQAHLAPAVQWLMSVVTQIPLQASEVIQELCGYAGKLLLPHFEEFLKVVCQVAQSAPSEVDASLHGALVGITRDLPDEQAALAFANVCDGAGMLLKSGLDISSEAGRASFHRVLSRLLRCVSVAEEAGTAPITAGAPKASRTASRCLARFLLLHWASTAPLCQTLLMAAPATKDAAKGKPIFEYSDVAVQVNVLALLRRAAMAAAEVPEAALAEGLASLAVACCKEGQLAPLSSMAALSANPDVARSHVMPHLDVISSAALTHVQHGRAAEDLIPFLDLCSCLAAAAGDALFASPQVPPLAQLSVAALASTEHDVLKPVLVFLQRLLTSRALSLGEGDVSSLAQAIFASFHTWPRSMNTQTFKVFSALAERHEQVYMSTIAAAAGAPFLVHLSPADRLLAQQGLARLRGPKLRALLGDLALLTRGEASGPFYSATLLAASIIDTTCQFRYCYGS
ncbi:unnamed protein product [Symbiodinium sp. CCMP2456]|nr:unnamed protein product [Symbiodinium sp. CCMP2456]